MDDVVGLLVTELVTNAIRHADSHVDVAIRLLPETLRVEVRDTAEGRPAVVDAGPDAERGRGLAMVDALAEAWGVEPDGHGKVVWFEISR
ncbi:MAG: ATP-binding protein [Acidimicrobiia bacterium]|nr:ATP-binding protein [Acidimicrobiia bacterium]